MKNIYFLVAIAAITIAGCCPENKSDEWPYNGIPVNAKVVNKWDGIIAFLEKDSVNGERIWIYNSETDSAELFLTCHNHRGVAFYDGTDGMVWPRDSICGICNVKIVRWFDHNKLVVVEECDARNTYTYLVTDTSAVLLTSNEGYMGTLLDKGWHVTQSYCYYEDGGRFSAVEYFDDNGYLMKKEEIR